MDHTIKVATDSQPTAVAGAIAGMIRGNEHVIVQAIGARAVNQAVKAVAISRNYLRQDGIDLICVPSFVDVDMNGVTRAAIKLSLETNGKGSELASSPPDPSPPPE